MKILFASCYVCDWIASTLWHGFRELVGAENVYDAWEGLRNLSGTEIRTEQLMGDEAGFDLLVINACFLRDRSWEWIAGHLGVETKGVPGGRLLPTARVVYVEGWDGEWDINLPHVPVDAIFRREIDERYIYPYECHPILMAVPEAFFETSDHERDIDVCYMVNAKSVGLRWELHDVLNGLPPWISRFLTPRQEFGAVIYSDYLNVLRRSKLCVCPPGAGSDCMRQWEAIALGAIPVFVGHAPRWRIPWFSSSEIFWCHDVADLPKVIEQALGSDLITRRLKMQANALKNHTIRARAQ